MGCHTQVIMVSVRSKITPAVLPAQAVRMSTYARDADLASQVALLKRSSDRIRGFRQGLDPKCIRGWYDNGLQLQ